MTRDQMLNDAYSRLTSRKLLLALLAIGFAVWSYHNGMLTAVELQASIMAAVAVYSATNAVETIATRPPPPVQTVNVDTQPAAPAPAVGRFSAEQLAQLAGEIERRMRETPAPTSEVTMTAGDRSITTKTWPPEGAGGLVTKAPTWLPGETARTN